ncbi:hypothetical protein GY45DRAFT_1349448 [Cubamyces sp. BRFM 1775]|nr:hypothetical protein GY45DRAFT_1349448 [Cubamyces sp. BRFM 1775]
MGHFDCATSDMMSIKISHKVGHLPYVDISIPDQWKQYIEEHASAKTSGAVHPFPQGLGVSEVSIPFTAKSVYCYWHQCTEKDWRFDQDPYVLACKYVQAKGMKNHICDMNIEAEPGMRAFGFYIRNTNSGNFEVFAAMADTDGCGVPLAFLFPDAKQQLCIWHALCADEKCLAKNKDTPAHYNIKAACHEFEFINPTFDLSSTVSPCALHTAEHPMVLTQSLPKLVLTPEAIARALQPPIVESSLRSKLQVETRTAEEIYHDAVNNLMEVWAYLWNSWYCHQHWQLWARSAYPKSIPRKCTTMIVEALWCGIKYLILHMHNRPCMDLALHSIVTRAIPPYQLTTQQML